MKQMKQQPSRLGHACACNQMQLQKPLYIYVFHEHASILSYTALPMDSSQYGHDLQHMLIGWLFCILAPCCFATGGNSSKKPTHFW